MNGAITEPFAKSNNPPNITKIMIIGVNHNFFRTFKKRKNSFIKLNINTDSRMK